MKSMTGFGQGIGVDSSSGIVFSAEINTVNKKQLDIKSILPREIQGYEPLLRRVVNEKINRGSVFVRVKISTESATAPNNIKINESLVAAVVKKCRKLQDRFELDQELSIKDILNVPGVIEENSVDYNNIPEIEVAFVESINNALDKLIVMRADEGARLKTDLEKRVKCLESIVTEIEPLTIAIPKLQRERLLKNLQDAELNIDENDDRVLKELALFAERSDVSEELTRLDSHFKQFDTFFEEEHNPIGRSMDFLIQELNREITTLSNKAIRSQISPLIVQFKTELEKLREQIQNIE